jgi:ATP-dependent RNA helicase DeaD
MGDEMGRKGNDGFGALGLAPQLVQALTALGYEEPTPIQREAIPMLVAGRDVVGQAATGTGKTAAFVLPILMRLAAMGKRRSKPSALILVPTRELAMQVAEAVHRYGRWLPVTVVPIYGGQSYGPQLGALERGVDVVVATPGRALDHIGRGTLRLDGIEVVVLDEADEMLDMGFAEAIESILGQTPEDRQTVLFSATVPQRIKRIAERHLTDPAHLEIAVKAVDTPQVRQRAYVVQRAYKSAALSRVLDVESPEKTLVFCRTRNDVDDLTEALVVRGYRAEALHGGLSQAQRDKVVQKLRRGALDLVVATDVAARGLDIEQLSHVVNYDAPPGVDQYVHRIGRVGRAGRSGVAITLVEPREHRLLRELERVTKQRIEMARIPTIADLRARRLELVRASVREALLAGELDGFRVVVEELAAEFDPFEVAVAAVGLLHQATKGDDADAEEIPAVEPAPRPRRERGRSAKRGGDRPPATSMVRLYIGLGRKAGVRPADLVGAIAGEAGIPGRAIGAIDIADGFSLVEVPEDVAPAVIDALRATQIRGKKVTVRRDRAQP